MLVDFYTSFNRLTQSGFVTNDDNIGVQLENRCGAVGGEGEVLVNDNVIEQAVIHKAAIAPVVVTAETLVFVQINGGNFLEADVACFVHFNQLLIATDGGGTGSETQYASGIFVGNLLKNCKAVRGDVLPSSPPFCDDCFL